MNWTDFLFGAVAGTSLVLVVAALFLYRVMRPYVQAAAVAAKAQAERRKTSRTTGARPTLFGASNRPFGEEPTEGNP